MNQVRQRLARATWENPVLVKEFRTRMRGTRAYWILFGYTLLIGGILALIYHAFALSLGDDPSSGARRAGDLGRALYSTVFILQGIMVALITPAITAGSITIEREQRSYDLLVTTPLRPADLVRGKLAAAVSFAVLLLTVSVPLVSLSFLVGGVSPAEIACAYLVTAAAAFLFGATGIYWSAALRATAAATVATYLTVLGFFLATLVPGFVAQERSWMGSGSGAAPDIPFQSLNPVMAAFRGVQPEHWFGLDVPSWIGAVVLLILAGMLTTQLAMARLEHFVPPRPVWTRLLATLTWAAFSFLLIAPIAGSYSRMGLPMRTLPDRLSEILTGLLVAGGVALVVLTIALNTAEPSRSAEPRPIARYLTGLLPHRLFGGELPNGLPLALLWAALFATIAPLGLAASGKLGLWRPGAYLPGVGVLLAMVFGLAALGHAVSVRTRNRWQAVVCTAVLAALLVGLPYGALAPLAEKGMRPSPLWSWLYTVPFEAITDAAGHLGVWSRWPPLPIRPMWPITVGLYALVGLLCVALATRRPARRAAAGQPPRAA